MSTTTLITKIRTLLDDNSSVGQDVFTYGNNRVFTLSEPNVIAVTDVARNDTSSGVSYTFNSSTNKVTIGSPLTVGDTINISYSFYPNYSDTEIKNYFKAALVHLSINNYSDIDYDSLSDSFYPTIEDREENLIAIIASTLINPDNRTIRLPDVTIQVPNDLPTNKKISQYIASFKRSGHGVFDVI